MELVNKDIETYARAHCQAEPAILQELTKVTLGSLEKSRMLSGHTEGRLLKLLAQLMGAKRILEIGTFSGYSGLSMAEALPEDGELITCDIDTKSLAVARSFFERCEHGKKIRIVEGPALETIATLDGLFDMVFIDADKGNYLKYYEAVMPIVRSGGLICVDNVLWSGRVLNPDSVNDKAIVALNSRIKNDERVTQVLLTVRDGIYLARKN